MPRNWRGLSHAASDWTCEFNKMARRLQLKNLHGLCTGCGTCAGICPAQARKMVLTSNGIYLPQVDESKCSGCLRCEDVCPIIEFDQTAMDACVHGRVRSKSAADIFLGCHLNTYIGYSLNKEVRWRASSGGLITSLLIWALNEGLIRGALVTRFNPCTKIVEPFIARNNEEIIASAGSKYLVVPVNTKIANLLKEEGPFAAVGLPCHLQGLRKAEMQDAALRDKVVMYLGLFCSGSFSTLSADFMLKSLSLEGEDIADVLYRGEGWPGAFKVSYRDGSITVPFHNYFPKLSWFYASPCLNCWDATAEYSDMSFGDAWLDELKKRRADGYSIVIVRTERGKEWLQSAESKGIISVKEIDPSLVLVTQQGSLNYKKRNFTMRRALSRLSGFALPDYRNIQQMSGTNPSSVIKTLYRYSRHCLMSNRSIRQNLVEPILSRWIRKGSIAQSIQARKHILLTGAISFANRGTAAIVTSTLESLKNTLPGARYSVELFYPERQRQLLNIETDDIRIVPHILQPVVDSPVKGGLEVMASFLAALLRKIRLSIPTGILKRYQQVDMIVDISAEAFVNFFGEKTLPTAGKYSRLSRYLAHLAPILMGFLLNKPVIIYAQTLGPFGGYKHLMRLVLKRASLVTVRDATSLEMLQKEGIDTANIRLTADPAFLLEPLPRDEVLKLLKSEGVNLESLWQQGRPVIGLVSQFFVKYFSDYRHFTKTLAQVADELIKRTNGYVLFIPFSSGEFTKESDDLTAGSDICSLMENKDSFRILKSGRTPAELEGIVGVCDVILSCRMHAVIMALQMGTPSVLIALNQKAYGLMQRVNQERFLADIRSLSAPELTEKICQALAEKETIREQLKEPISKMREAALLSARLVADATQMMKSKSVSASTGRPDSLE